MDFNEYQREAAQTDQTPRGEDGTRDSPREPKRHDVIPLLGLISEVGGLLAEYKKLLRDGATHRKFRDEVAEELGDILWYVTNVATKFDLELEDIARSNLDKTRDRWLRTTRPAGLYDDGFAEDQRLPRRFEYSLEHREIEGVTKLVLVDLLGGGDTTGDPLTDNTYEDDGYRYHDILHLCFAACFGWSPVLRKLLRTKKQIVNRTPREIGDSEDGGRARVIEEAIVAAAYVYASDHDFLAGVDAVDWHLLRHIKQLTAKIEVGNRTAWEWNAVLLRGFELWRGLRAHGSGVIRGDLLAGTIEFNPQRR